MLSYLVLQLALSEFRQNGFDLNRRHPVTVRPGLHGGPVVAAYKPSVHVCDAASDKYRVLPVHEPQTPHQP